MEKWIEDNKQRLLRLQTTGIDAEEKLSLELIAEIERLEMDNALVRGGNEEKRNQIESLEATLATYKAVADAMQTIKQILGYGIYGCPTNGKYHRETYQQAFDIAQQTLNALRAAKEGK